MLTLTCKIHKTSDIHIQYIISNILTDIVLYQSPISLTNNFKHNYIQNLHPLSHSPTSKFNFFQNLSLRPLYTQKYGFEIKVIIQLL